MGHPNVNHHLHHHAHLFDQVAVHLVKGGGEQHGADFKKLNPMEQVGKDETHLIDGCH